MVWREVKPHGEAPIPRINHTFTLITPASGAPVKTACTPQQRALWEARGDIAIRSYDDEELPTDDDAPPVYVK